MIALLSYSSSWCQSNASFLPTGELKQDSVLVSIDDLRKANAKMTELKYEKELNTNLREALKNDEVIINTLKEENYFDKKQLKKYKVQTIVLGSVTLGLTILSLVLAIK